MQASIGKLIDDLKESNATLEHKVLERTEENSGAKGNGRGEES